MKKYLIKIIQDAMWPLEDRINDHKKMNLDHTADLAQLIIDSRNNNLTMKSRDFLMRMNIHPDEFLKNPKS